MSNQGHIEIADGKVTSQDTEAAKDARIVDLTAQIEDMRRQLERGEALARELAAGHLTEATLSRLDALLTTLCEAPDQPPATTREGLMLLRDAVQRAHTAVHEAGLEAERAAAGQRGRGAGGAEEAGGGKQ